jgi:hypothetical protein
MDPLTPSKRIQIMSNNYEFFVTKETMHKMLVSAQAVIIPPQRIVRIILTEDEGQNYEIRQIKDNSPTIGGLYGECVVSTKEAWQAQFDRGYAGGQAVIVWIDEDGVHI